MADIFSLAPELVHKICELLDVADRKRVRLTCKHIGGLLQALVLHTIHIHFTKDNFTEATGMLRSLVTSEFSQAASGSVRGLVLGSLSPKFEPYYWKKISGHWVTETESNVTRDSAVALAEEELRKYLGGALLSLSELQTVRWEPEVEDEEWAQEMAVSALKSLPNLRSFSVRLTHMRIALPLASFKHISDVSVIEHGSHAAEKSQTLKNLAEMIANLPPGQLTRLHIQFEYNDSAMVQVSETQSLHHLLRLYSTGNPPLRLKHLGLINSFFKFDEITTRHLLHLTSLNLSNVVEPQEPQVSQVASITQDVFTKQCLAGSTASEIWINFAHLEIQLENITIDRVIPSFLHYLASYSGLTRLVLSVAAFESSKNSDASATCFFGDALNRHSQSLEKLDICASYEGLWCFGKHNLNSISRLRSLRSLGLSVVSKHIRGTDVDSDSENQVNEDTVDDLIHTVAHMPRLFHLKISPARSEESRGVRGGVIIMKHYSSVTNKLVERFRSYKAPPSLPHLPDVVVGSKIFQPERAINTSSESGNEFMYWHFRFPAQPPT